MSDETPVALLPCPFCGKPGEVVTEDPKFSSQGSQNPVAFVRCTDRQLLAHGWVIHPNGCGAESPHFPVPLIEITEYGPDFEPRKAQAIAWWNRRANRELPKEVA